MAIDFQIYIVSSHPFVSTFLLKSLLREAGIKAQLNSGRRMDLAALTKRGGGGIFLLDMSSLPFGQDELQRLLVLRRTGTKFLALLHPPKFTDGEMLRLLYMGFDGFVELTEDVARGLPKVLQVVSEGNLWAPRRVLQEFINRAQVFLSLQLHPNPSLTAREHQVFLLLLRNLSNREIAHALGITERTTKFHVSNALSKMGFPNRNTLFNQFELLIPPDAGLPMETGPEPPACQDLVLLQHH